MPCPTCDHTMQLITRGVFWCPRCGTLKVNGQEDAAPMLVERCRQFTWHSAWRLAPHLAAEWNRLGIEESIKTPENRLK